MALISCPNCNNPISSEARECPHCGMKLTMKNICQECGVEYDAELKNCPNCGYTNVKLIKHKKSFSKKIIFGLIGTVCLLLIVVMGLLKSDVFLSDDMKMIKMAVNEVQDTLLNPESLKIYECKMLDNNDKIYIYLYAGAENKSGGISDDKYMVCIIDGTVDSFADSEDAKQSGLSGNSAASELTWSTAMGRSSWKEFDKKEVQKLVK